MNGAQRRHAPIPLPIKETMTEERLSKAKGIIYKRQRVLKKETTKDAYADSYIFDARLYKNVLIHVINKHTSNSITFKVLACIDPNDWSTLEEDGVSEFPVLATKDKALSLTVAWAYVKVQVKSTTAGNAGTVNAYIAGSTP